MTKLNSGVMICLRGDKMAREARDKALFSTYYIKQICPEQKIFKTKEDRKILMDTLIKVKEKYNFKLYKMSISPNGYEMIIYDNGNDVSKIMKSINISFAMQYKCKHEACKTIFKERYKSRIIDPCDINNEIQSLPICAYATSDLFDPYLVEDAKVTDCLDCKEKAHQKLIELIESEGYTFESMLKDKKYRNSLIKNFRKQSILSLCELGELFGGLSESAISKILSR